MNPKQIAGEKAASYIKDNMTVGLGTGSTAYWAIKKIGERIASEGLKLICTATSVQSEILAKEHNIPLTSVNDIPAIDITIDGADEIDHHLNMIKGGGGALLREKIIAWITKEYIIVADESKYVQQLGKFKLPVEVVPFGWERTKKHLESLGGLAAIRKMNNDVYITDNGNYIIDCDFGILEHVHELQANIHNIPGVVVCGLFLDRTSKLIIGKNNGEIQEITPAASLK